MPLAAWGPACNTNREGVVHYGRVPNSDTDSVQIQWNQNYSPGYITSIASGLPQAMGSKTTLSEGSATESQTNLNRPNGLKPVPAGENASSL